MHAVYPNLECQQRDVKVSYINSCTGLDLDAEHITGLLRRMALTAEASPGSDSVHVEVPPSRSDILHDCDVMEVRQLYYDARQCSAIIPANLRRMQGIFKHL